MNYSVDLCIIGGAGSGLAAAVRAAECGVKKVLLMDKNKMLGGCTRLIGGMFSVESPAQKRLGIHETADDCFKNHMDQSGWDCDSKLVRKWITGTGDNIRWLEEKGVYIEKVVSFSGQKGQTKSLYHMSRNQQTGMEIVKGLTESCEKYGVEILVNTSALKLIKDGSGAVTGVIAKQGENEIIVDAKKVIIATGAISANKELMQRFYPNDDFTGVKIMSAVKHNTGDGLIMAEEAGAKTGGVSTVFIGPHNHPYNMRVGLIMRRPYMVLLNRNGERFVDESISANRDWGWMMALAVDKQPGKICYPIMDSTTLDYMIEHRRNLNNVEAMQSKTQKQDLMAGYESGIGVPVDESKSNADWLLTIKEDIQKEIESGRAIKANSIEDAAEWIGCDPNTLKSSIENYNISCENGYDSEMLKEATYMYPVKNNPFYVFKGHSGIDTCLGGIVINHRQEVLGKDMNPIPGLYAVGVCTSGWVGSAYGYFGSCMSYVIYSGYAAGENAAKALRKG